MIRFDTLKHSVRKRTTAENFFFGTIEYRHTLEYMHRKGDDRQKWWFQTD